MKMMNFDIKMKLYFSKFQTKFKLMIFNIKTDYNDIIKTVQ